MFSNGLIDLHGRKTRRSLHADDPLIAKLKQEFPNLTADTIEELLQHYHRAEYKVKNSGKVLVYASCRETPQELTAPKSRADQKFANSVFASDRKLLVCVKWHEGNEYVLSYDEWLFSRSVKGICGSNAIAMYSDWLVKEDNRRLSIYRETDSGYMLNKTTRLEDDFNLSSLAEVLIKDI